MGLFSKKETCCICNQNEGDKKIENGMICESCFAKCGHFAPLFGLKKLTSENILQAMQVNERNNKLMELFHTTKKFEKYLDIDEHNKIWGSPCFSPRTFFTYDDIVDFELLENGNSVTKGGLGSAVVGGALMGGVGAIVGSNIGKKKTKQEITEYRIKIVTRNPIYPEIFINLLTAGKVKSTSIVYKSYSNAAQRIISLLTLITDECSQQTVNNPYSPADEIIKYKQLLDDGVITQEEFDRKKQQLLNL